MTDDVFAKLRAPFPSNLVGKLPKVWCRACREATKRGNRPLSCEQNGHEVKVCNTCKARMTSAHMHVDYVGHAHVTERLLQVDPRWTWEPLALAPDGFPLLDSHNGMWIRLTVAGVTRLGYGHPDGKSGGDAVKETIGDAIRNAALRFGVAIDLWMKERATGPGEAMPTRGNPQVGDTALVDLRMQIINAAKVRGLPATELVEDDFRTWAGDGPVTDIREASVAVLAEYLAAVKRRPIEQGSTRS